MANSKHCAKWARCDYATQSGCKKKNCFEDKIEVDKGHAVLSNSTDGLSAEALAEIKTALTELVDLKEHKDLHGKTEHYKAVRPRVWRQAFEALGR